MYIISMDKVDNEFKTYIQSDSTDSAYIFLKNKGGVLDLINNRFVLFDVTGDQLSFDNSSQRVAGVSEDFLKPQQIEAVIKDLPTQKRINFREDGSVSLFGGGPTGIGFNLALQPGGELLVVSNRYSNAYVINVTKALSADQLPIYLYNNPELFVKVNISPNFSATGLRWSPKGNLLAISRSIALQLYKVKSNKNTINLEQISVPPTHQAIGCMAFSPDEQMLAIGGKELEVKIIDLEKQQVLAEVKDQNAGSSELLFILFSPSGQYVLTGSKDKVLKLWKLPDSNDNKVLKLVDQKRVPGQLLQATFYPSIRGFLVAWEGNNSIHISKMAFSYSVHQDIWKEGSERTTENETAYGLKVEEQEAQIARTLRENVSFKKTQNDVALMIGIDAAFPNICIGCGKKDDLEHYKNTPSNLKGVLLCPECRKKLDRSSIKYLIAFALFIGVIAGGLALDVFNNIWISGILSLIIAVLATYLFLKIVKPENPFPDVLERDFHEIYRFKTSEIAEEFRRLNPLSF